MTENDNLQNGYVTLIKNIEGEISYPYSIAKAIITQDFSSDLEADLNAIHGKHQAYENGSEMIYHSVKTERLANPQRLGVTGGATGNVEFDGTAPKTLKLTIADDSHEHSFETIPGLREELEGKLTIEHDHKRESFGVVTVNDTIIEAKEASDTLSLISGSNIELEVNEEGHIEVNAILADVEARNSRRLNGHRPQDTADKNANEVFIPLANYGGKTDLGQCLDLHLPASRKEYDVRLGIESDLNLYVTKGGQSKCQLWHEGNMGHGTGLNADKLDGKHADAFSEKDHRHEMYEKEIDTHYAHKGQKLWYTPREIENTLYGTDGIPSKRNAENYEGFLDWKLNALMEKHPDYIKRRILSKDQSESFNIYAYTFTPEDYDRTILLSACTHGNEVTGFFGLCRLLEQICEHYKEDSALSELRHRTRLVVVPILNPWGFCHDRRQNSRDVDLNRNTSFQWESYTNGAGIGETYYKGEAPFSERETRAFKELVTELKKDKSFHAYIDLHTITTIQAEKVLYYPRHQDGAHMALAKTIHRYDSETGQDRTIFSGSYLPTLLNYATTNANILGCNPEWNNSCYSSSRDEFLMTKYVEWVGNVLLTLMRHEKKKVVGVAQPFTKLLKWSRDLALGEVEGNDHLSSKGHRILKSETYNSFSSSRYDFEVDGHYVMNLSGHVQVFVEETCTLHLDPLIYQQCSSGQNYEVMSEECRFEEVVTLTPGMHYIPIQGVLHLSPTNYNNDTSSRNGTAHFRLRGKTNQANAVWITGYKATLSCTPTDKGLPIEVIELKDAYETIYPTFEVEGVED